MHCDACGVDHSPFDDQHLPSSSRFGVVEAWCGRADDEVSVAVVIRGFGESGPERVSILQRLLGLIDPPQWETYLDHRGLLVRASVEQSERGSWPTTQSEKPADFQARPTLGELYAAAADAVRSELDRE